MTDDVPLIWRMPTHFGPCTGPRQGPNGERFGETASRRTTAAVHFLTERDALARLLPPRFELAGHPIVTVVRNKLENLAWLAGRGYSTFGARFPVRFRGRRDDVSGLFLAVLWENMADPIITGREELGYSKVYGELPEPEMGADYYRARAEWDGHRFAALTLNCLEPADTPFVPDYGLSNNAGVLHYKYVPRTGAWGAADAEYPTLTPTSGSTYKAQWVKNGSGEVQFIASTWEQLPTLVHIVNALAALPVKHWLGASLEYGIGGKDLRDQRALA